MNTELNARYINAKYSKVTIVELLTLQQDVAKELEEIKFAKDQVFRDYPGVHGRFQHSQLEVLDIREQKVCAMFDNIGDMIFARRNQK